jgi:drug/metabolite transporter (DMT)-like permease
VAGLAFLATGVAYLLYFRLIAHVGPARAISVTYLIPLFGVLWGALFLGEAVTPAMFLGGAIILAGTALVTGVVSLPFGRRRAA